MAEIALALGAVDDLIEAYRDANDALVVPIRVLGENGLVHVFQQLHGIKITLGAVPWKGNHLNACVFRFGTPGKVERAEIYCDSALSVGWMRFAIAKELAHLLLEGPDDFLEEPVHYVQGLVDSPLFNKHGGNTSEYVFHLAAMEMLMPWKRREFLLGMNRGFGAAPKIAEHFGVPEVLVKLRLKRRFRKKLEAHHQDLEDFLRRPKGTRIATG